MRFLVDECTGSEVAVRLRGQGHEVYSIFDEARGSTDDEILDKACAENWIIVTNDKDFGELVFHRKRHHRGIIFLRLEDSRNSRKVAALQQLLAKHCDDLIDHYTIVRETLIRVIPR